MCKYKPVGSEGLEGSGGEPLRRVFGWANGREGVGGVAFADTAVCEEDWGKKGERGAEPRKTKQGVRRRSTKQRRRSISHHTSVFFFFSSGRVDHGERQHPTGALRRVEEPRHCRVSPHPTVKNKKKALSIVASSRKSPQKTF